MARVATPLDRLYNPDVGLLILRIVLGIIFIGHGSQKLFGAFGGPGIGGITGYLGSLGVPMPGVMAWVVGLFEFLGGWYVLLGFLTGVGGIMISCVMLSAIWLVHLAKGFWNGNGGVEFPLALLAAALALVFTGPGRYSVEGALNDIVVRTRPVTTV